MNRSVKSFLIFIICILLVFTQGATAADIDTVLNETAAYVYSHTPSPSVGSVGGEWAVIGLKGSGYTVPTSYYEGYYNAVCQYAKEHGGVLSNSKYTEYSRVIIALTAIGSDPTSVAGYDLIAPLSDERAVTKQGLNGAIWALIALDSGGYTMPVSKDSAAQATREGYIRLILDRELPGGGWALSAASVAPDTDITAMALQALSKYRSCEDVMAATERGLDILSASLESGEACDNTEAAAQILIALCKNAINYTEPRFVKDGKTVLDKLLGHRLSDGSFTHKGTDTDMMATEQALCALAAAARFERGESSLYYSIPRKSRQYPSVREYKLIR